jgi:hypothetical protein
VATVSHDIKRAFIRLAYQASLDGGLSFEAAIGAQLSVASKAVQGGKILTSANGNGFSGSWAIMGADGQSLSPTTAMEVWSEVSDLYDAAKAFCDEAHKYGQAPATVTADGWTDPLIAAAVPDTTTDAEVKARMLSDVGDAPLTELRYDFRQVRMSA